MLRGILNASDAVYVPYESDFLARAYPFYQGKRIKPADYRRLANFFSHTSQQRGWGLSPDAVYEALAEAGPTSFAGVNDVIYKSYLCHKGLSASSWGIKTPVLIANLDRVLSVFPNSKIIHLVRDGRDVYLSYKKVHEGAPKPFGPNGVVQAALYWVDGLRRVEQVPSERLHELRYEDLVEDPAAAIEGLCGFLGIPYEASLWQSYQSSDRNRDLLLPSESGSIHSNVKRRISSERASAYAHRMSPRERHVFESVAGPCLAKYGYPCEPPPPNSAWIRSARFVLYSAARAFNTARYAVRDYKYMARASAPKPA